jgi:hypothetical protein
MQEIIKHLEKNNDILGPLLKTNYFSWQSKYLESMVYLGNIYSLKKKPWRTRDIILLFKSQLTKVQLVAALMKHSKDPGLLRYVLNEKELLEISGLINRIDGDFVKDFLIAAELHSLEVFKKAQQFVYFLEPSLKSHKKSSFGSQLPTNNHGTKDFETTLSQMTNIMERVIGTQTLKPIFQSINEFVHNSESNTITGSYSDSDLINTVIQNINQYIGSLNKSEGGYVEEVSSEEYSQLAIK